MKPLKVLAITTRKENIDLFKHVVGQIKSIETGFEMDLENAISLMNNPKYDLLVLDKNLSENDMHKMNKMAEILQPDLPVLEMRFEDKDFIHFKMSEMLQKWIESQSESETKFYDDGINSK